MSAPVDVLAKCCCGCGRPADGPQFSTPYDATNRYRGGKTSKWASACWARNVAQYERRRAEAIAQDDAAIARCKGGAS